MTIERALELAENWAAGRVNNLTPGEIAEYNGMAAAALRRAKAQKENRPLTRDDLLQMDGAKVWVEFEPYSIEEPLKIWVLVSVDEETGEVYLENDIGGSSAYNEVFAEIRGIYRRKRQ